MLPLTAARQVLERYFNENRVAELGTISELLETTSRMSVFRRLSAIGYLTSYSHNGRFYTLADIPRFDEHGLWQHQGVCFSRHGSLKATVKEVVEAAEAGKMHHELRDQLQVRVQNVLLGLVQEGQLSRRELEAQYLYLSDQVERAQEQWERRLGGEVNPALMVEVLLEVVRSVGVCPPAEPIARRLADRGVLVTVPQVEIIYQRHGLKKTLS